MQYLVHNQLNYPDGHGGECQAEVGDMVDNLPAISIPWLLADGLITPVTDEEGE